MATSPHLQRKLKDQLGTDAGNELANELERVDALKAELTGLRQDIARLDSRFDPLEARIHTAIEKGLREQTRFFFLAWSVLVAAIVGLYAR